MFDLLEASFIGEKLDTILKILLHQYSIFTLEDQGYNLAFVNGQVLTWHKSSSIDKAIMIGV